MKSQKTQKKGKRLSSIERRFGRDFGEGSLKKTVEYMEKLGYSGFVRLFSPKDNAK